MLLLPLALATAGQAMAIEHYEGLAYEKKSGKLLYRESHWLQEGQRLVLYRCPDGKPFARKKVLGASAAPDFELVDARDGYREGVRTRAGVREVYSRASAGVAEKSKVVPGRNNQVIDAGFDAYVRQQWDALASPDKQRIAFLIPSRLQDMDFKLSPLAGNAVCRRYALALDAWYGGVVPSLTVTYSTADRRLLRFEGIGNIRTAAGKYPTVRIEFPADKRSATNSADLAGAANAPLVRSCGNP
ncbi:MAG: hypothetical protein ACREO7_13095 [Pseudoxanthomonas sp.]